MSPPIYQYLDFRKYLRDAIEMRKASSPHYSMEVLSRQAGVMTKPHLSLILAGKRSLSEEKANAIGSALQLSAQELYYYQHLVKFNQAKSDRVRESYLKVILTETKRRSGDNLPTNSYRVLESWHFFVIRELARMPRFDPDPHAIAKRLRDLLTPSEANTAVNLLLDTRLLMVDSAGNLVASDEALRTTDEINSLAIRSFHRSCLELGKRILELDPIEEREFASMNILLKTRDKAKLKNMIKAFREEVLFLSADGETGHDAQVAQVNIQMFNIGN
ncbi:MAG: TIGR02147 family protein [Proteobacteria bacterium]|nr:MAG: TIGR02147 family protein [Pseudomonadota bacterium]